MKNPTPMMAAITEALGKIDTARYTPAELSEMTGYDKTYLRNFMDYRKIAYRKVYTNSIPQTLKTMDTSQYTTNELATMLGCSKRTISYTVCQLNLKTKRSRTPKIKPEAPTQTQAQNNPNRVGFGLERVMTLWYWHTLNPT